MSSDLHTSARRYRASAAVFAVLALGLALAAAVVLVSRPAALVSRDAAPGR